MRSFARNILFSYLALYFLSTFFSGISFGGLTRNMILVALGVGMVNLLIRPALKIMSLWHQGLGYLFLGIFINLICVFLISRFYDGFDLGEGVAQNLNVFGFMIESYGISEYWSYILTATVLSVFISFGSWVTSQTIKKKHEH
jgi:uncharacterized membrane protein YvlD (DUF360 family)